MATIAFSAESMRRELKIFSDVAKTFLDAGSVQRFVDLERDLEHRRAKAAKAADAAEKEFSWSTNIGAQAQPVRTRPSTNYKGAVSGSAHKPMLAEVSFAWECRLDEDGDRVFVREGWVSVTLCATEGDGGAAEKTKVIHYDVCRGGHGGGAAHPPIHLQFHGFMNDVPRFPTFLVHPVDVLDFFMHELFQGRWRDHLATAEARSKLRGFPGGQRARVASYFARYGSLIAGAQRGAIPCLQSPLALPMELHVSGCE